MFFKLSWNYYHSLDIFPSLSLVIDMLIVPKMFITVKSEFNLLVVYHIVSVVTLSFNSLFSLSTDTIACSVKDKIAPRLQGFCWRCCNFVCLVKCPCLPFYVLDLFHATHFLFLLAFCPLSFCLNNNWLNYSQIQRWSPLNNVVSLCQERLFHTLI